MIYPSIDDLVYKADSKYSLVILASKRARQLLEGQKTQLQAHYSRKYVGVALEEIANDVLLFSRRASKQATAVNPNCYSS
jgi:DNA-directed RNA polymerase subunit omega